MKKNTIIIIAVAAVAVLAVVGLLGYKVYELSNVVTEKNIEHAQLAKDHQQMVDSLREAEKMRNTTFTEMQPEEFNAELEAHAEEVKQQMMREYEAFIQEAERLKAAAGAKNKALQTKLEREQQRTRELLEELRNTKASNTAEINRLRDELANLRAILRSYVAQVDSLNRQNQALHAENQNLRNQHVAVQQEKAALESEKQALNEKVAIASVLDATGLYAHGLNKKGKNCEKVKDVKRFEVRFNIARNVTAQTGMKTVYVRIATPTGSILTQGGSFSYENRQLEYSMSRDVEYTGEETPVTCYWEVGEALSPGSYRVDIFADGHNIGSTSFSLK